MTGAILGLLSMVGIAALTGWPLFSGLRHGVIYARRIGYSRIERPSDFWFHASCYALAFTASAGYLIYFAIEAARG